jgi:hypothetical protein
MKIAPKPLRSDVGAAVDAADAQAQRGTGAAPASARVVQRNTHIEIPAEYETTALRDLVGLSRQLRFKREEIDGQLKAVDEAISVKRDAIAEFRDSAKGMSDEDFDDMMVKEE